MDSGISDEQRSFARWMHAMYILFMGFLFIAFSKFEGVPVTKSVKRVQIAATLLAINFFVVWFALLKDTHQLVVYTYPVAFNLVCFTTMISAPGVLIYTMLQYQNVRQPYHLLR